jgi:2-amino-4-hydroxy-6-hydroxymethyldihydropteridine diphosphokinase
MARVYLGLGSNIEPEKNIRFGISELGRRYGVLDLSPAYRSAALGFEADDFLNMVVGLDSVSSPSDICEQIESIHELVGRERRHQKLASRPLDIDLLLYDDVVRSYAGFRLPRADVLEYSFVLRPLSEIAPSLHHPETGKTLAEHWRAFDAQSHPLEPVDVLL